MRRVDWLFLGILVVASLHLSACTQASPAKEIVKPASIEKVDGSEFSTVTLTEKAAERIGIRTEPVRKEKVLRTRVMAGEVVDPQASPANITLDPGKALVRVYINSDDQNDVDRARSALVISLDDEDDPSEVEGNLVEELANDVGINGNKEGKTPLYIVVNDENHQLEVEQRLLVELTLKGSGVEQNVIPYAAVIYGLKGETWVYVNAEPQVFSRRPITIDYIDGDLVVLKEGPETGTAVVTVGVAELFGAETGVSK